MCTFFRDPADKLIRHRACSLRDNAYSLIKAELDSDFEDKCREISKNRKVLSAEDKLSENNECSKSDINVSNSHDKVDKSSKDVCNSSNSPLLNGRRSSSRKRKIPAWARGYVKKNPKKKKISFEDNNGENENKSFDNIESAEGNDVLKLQDMETEITVNGHIISNDNSDSDNESHSEL